MWQAQTCRQRDSWRAGARRRVGAWPCPVWVQGKRWFHQPVSLLQPVSNREKYLGRN